MRSQVRLVLAACAIVSFSSSVRADDVGAAGRGVVRIIAASEDNSDPDNTSVSFGSGFAISPHRVVTNAHVVVDAESAIPASLVAVVPAEGNRALRATIVAYDPARDLAVVDVGAARLEPLAIYSGPVDSGDHAAALGYPGNVDLAVAHSMNDLITPMSPVRSEGNISSNRTINGMPALLHTAAISRGNSGGPLVDGCGRVIGVNTYVTQSGPGDAPFGFAIVSQKLMSFLRDQKEQFKQIGSACVPFAEQAQREQQTRDAAARERQVALQRTASEQQRQIDTAKAKVQNSRENHAIGAALLAVLAVIAGVLGAALFIKDRAKAAAASATVAALSLAVGAYSFFTRPSLDVSIPPLSSPAAAATAPLTGKLLCQVKPDISRITVSSTDDVAMSWNNNGCMNGRTQYVPNGNKCRRILVPNGSETAFIQDFDPVQGEYVSTRYLLPQGDMDRLRTIRRGNLAMSCNPGPHAMGQLRELTEQLARLLPATPNERLVYHCAAQDHQAAGDPSQ